MQLPLSIVIPTRNEEKFLPLLLQSIQEQTAQPTEIIVADNNSTDATRDIAKKYHCIITQGGNHPGIGRNKGAKIASQPYLLFLDADVKLPRDFLERNFQEFQERKLGSASCLTIPDSNSKLMHLGAFINNLYFILTERFLHNAFGFCIFTTSSVFEKLNGFDESIKIAEDWDYAARTSKIAPYRFLKSRKIIVSTRRFAKEGKISLTIKYLRIFFHTTFRGKITEYIVPYSFSHQYEDSERKEGKRN